MTPVRGEDRLRIYLPATWPMLARTVKTGNFEPLGGTAFALTPKLRESYTAATTRSSSTPR